MASVITRDGPAAPLIDTVAALWPDAEVRLARGRVPERDLLAELALVPNAEAPRLAVPVTPATAASSSLRRISAASGPREVLARVAAAQFVRFGGVSALPDRVRVRGSARNSLLAHLEREFGHPLTFSIWIGSDRVNRKPVLELFDTRGNGLGFVKVGLGPVARNDVEAEAAALARLAPLRTTDIAVPRIIHAAQWRDAPVLVIERLPSPGTIIDLERGRIPIEWMREFSRCFAEPARALDELPWWTDLVAQLQLLQADEARVAALTCAASVRASASAPVPVSAWHGDWTPWNMARHRRGLSLWDWERFETGVPAGLDVIHYEVNVQTVRQGTTPAAVAQGIARAARHLPGSRAEARVLAGIYLTAITTRYLRLAEGPGGGAIADRATCFLAAWEEWSRPG